MIIYRQGIFTYGIGAEIIFKALEKSYLSQINRRKRTRC